jgi:WD40 repeat protein
LESGKFLKTFGTGNEPNDPTRSRLHSAAAITTSDGRYLFSTGEATANFGEKIEIKQPKLSQWEWHSGKLLRTFDHANATVITISPDGQHLVSGTKAGELKLWNVSSGSLLGSYTPQDTGAFQGNSSFRGVSIADGVVRALFAKRLMAFDLRSLALISEVPAEETHGQLTASRDGRWGAVLGYYSKWKLDLMDLRTGQMIRRFEGLPLSHRVAVGNAVMSPDGKRVVVVGIPTGLGIWDVESGAQLVAAYPGGVEPETQVLPGALDFDWVSMTPEGFFSAAPRASDLISVVRGLQPYSVEQVWQSLYNPDLLREKLAGDPDNEVEQASKVTNLEKVLSSGTPPVATITSHAQRTTSQEELITVRASVTEQEAGGIGRIEWRLNGITAGITHPANNVPTVEANQVFALDPGENTIDVVAYNGRNSLASVPARVVLNFGGPSATTKPKLHIFAIGINAYVDRGWTPPGASAPIHFPPLNLAVDDAKALSEALRKGGDDQYSDVHVTHVLDADATLEGLEEAINKAAVETHPRDTFVLFVAAHGISEGGRFFLIPQDFQGGPNALVEKAVSQARLQDWIVNRIKAKRALILLDTCESGAVVGGHTRSRTDGPDSEAAIGRLHEATGRPVLTAAAEGKPAFEGFENHGVFTWTLLDALKNGDRNANGTIELSELVGHVQDQVPRISAKLNGRGRAAIAARGNADDRQSARFGSRGEDFSIVRRLP